MGKAPKQSLIIKNSLCYILQVSIIPLVQLSSDLVYRSSFSLICCINTVAHLGLNTSRRYSCILLAWTFLSQSLQRISSLIHFSHLLFHCSSFNRREKNPYFSNRVFLEAEWGLDSRFFQACSPGGSILGRPSAMWSKVCQAGRLHSQGLMKISP